MRREPVLPRLPSQSRASRSEEQFVPTIATRECANGLTLRNYPRQILGNFFVAGFAHSPM